MKSANTWSLFSFNSVKSTGARFLVSDNNAVLEAVEVPLLEGTLLLTEEVLWPDITELMAAVGKYVFLDITYSLL